MGYSACAGAGGVPLGRDVVLAQSNYTGQPLWWPVIDARASPNIISLSAVTNRTSALRLKASLLKHRQHARRFNDKRRAPNDGTCRGSL